jgi:putative aminopeptidase FrvX
MHTCAELLNIEDAEATANIVKAFICSKEIAEVFAR